MGGEWVSGDVIKPVLFCYHVKVGLNQPNLRWWWWGGGSRVFIEQPISLHKRSCSIHVNIRFTIYNLFKGTQLWRGRGGGELVDVFIEPLLCNVSHTKDSELFIILF